MMKEPMDEYADLKKQYSDEELADAFVFPSDPPTTPQEIKEDEEFWRERRRQFKNRTTQQKIHSKMLQLKFELEDYVRGSQYDESLNFGYFLNQYINRQEKQDKQFAAEIDVKPTVLSQYLNNHRKPTEKFVIRLELHSRGMITALVWLKLLQKNKEHEIMTDTIIRKIESKHIKNRLEFAY